MEDMENSLVTKKRWDDLEHELRQLEKQRITQERRLRRRINSPRLSKSYSKSRPFVVSHDDLKKLDATLRRHRIKPTYSFKCSDGLERKVPTLKHLLEYENAPKRAITGLTINGSSEDWGKDVHLSFGGDRLSDYIFFSVNGYNEGSLVKLLEALEEQIAGLRPWYSAIARIDFGVLIIGFYILLWIAAAFMSMLLGTPSGKPLPFGTALVTFGMLVTIIVVPLLIAFALNRIKDWAFPRAAFLIGQGEKRYKNKELVRWGVVIAFVVNVVAGLALVLLPH